MTAQLTSLAVVSISLALTTASPVPQGAAGSPPATQGAAASRPGSLVLTAVGEKGDALQGAAIAVHGATVDRAGTTGVDGAVTLTNLPAGTYRARITRDGFFTLEKEVAIRAGARTTAEAVLSAAPPPPPPPPAPTPVQPTPTPSTLKAGQPQVVLLTELADQLLKDPKATEREIGCSGATSSRLILVREPLSLHRHVDVDETLYVMAGEGSLTLGSRDQTIGPGSVVVVPRGTSHQIVKRGRGPAVALLSVQSGEACK